MSLQYSTFTRITSATRNTLSGTDGNVIEGTAAYETDTNKIIIYYNNEWKTFNSLGKRNISLEGIKFEVASEPTLTTKIASSDAGTFFFNDSTTVKAFEISKKPGTTYRFADHGHELNITPDYYNVYTANNLETTGISKATYLTHSDIASLTANDIITNPRLNEIYMPTTELNRGPKYYKLQSNFPRPGIVSYFTDMGTTLAISAVQLDEISSEPYIGGELVIAGINESLSSIGIYTNDAQENTIHVISNVGDQKESHNSTHSMNFSASESGGVSGLCVAGTFDAPYTSDAGWTIGTWFKVYPDTPGLTNRRLIFGYATTYYASVSSEPDGSNPMLHNSVHFGDYEGTPGELSYNQWHHLIITKEPGTGSETMKTYLDGVLKHTHTQPHASVYVRDFGKTNGKTYTNFLHGAVHNFTIWDYVLQQGDVTNLSSTFPDDMTISDTYSALPYRMFASNRDTPINFPTFIHYPNNTHITNTIYNQSTDHDGTYGITVATGGLRTAEINNIPIYVEDKPDF